MPEGELVLFRFDFLCVQGGDPVGFMVHFSRARTVLVQISFPCGGEGGGLGLAGARGLNSR
jgi:hypothetical protein